MKMSALLTKTLAFSEYRVKSRYSDDEEEEDYGKSVF
jgi:hypothetical protein